MSEIIDGLKAYVESTHDAKNLVQTVVQLHSTNSALEHAEEVCHLNELLSHLGSDTSQWLDCALAALHVLNGKDFAQIAESVPQPYLESSPLTEVPYDLPSVLVPPEIVEVDNLTTESGEDAQVKKEEWPQCYIRLFEDEVRSV